MNWVGPRVEIERSTQSQAASQPSRFFFFVGRFAALHCPKLDMNPNHILNKTSEQSSCWAGLRLSGCGDSNPLFKSCGLANDQQNEATKDQLAKMVGADDVIGGKEFNELSKEEREQIIEEIHGVADLKIEEGPDLIERSMRNLDDELKRVTKYESRVAYERAAFLAPRLVKNRDFRLMFLRADIFDAKKAARRMTNYFQSKVELFGEDKLLKDITLEDLDEDDLATLMTGGFMLLPSKDRSGRTIMFVSQKYLKYKSWKNLVRHERRHLELVLLSIHVA